MTLVCTICGKTTAMKPGALRQRSGKFCSTQCQRIARSRRVVRIWVTCRVCGVSFLRLRTHVRDVNYCSRKCVGLARQTPGSIWSEVGPKSEAAKRYFREWQRANRQHVYARNKEWNRKNPEKRAAIRKRWNDANRGWRFNNVRMRRARTKAPDAASYRDWLDVLAAHGGKCAHCGTTARIECDHILPVARGGQHTKSNLQPLCRSCNATKNARIGIETRET